VELRVRILEQIRPTKQVLVTIWRTNMLLVIVAINRLRIQI